jgi:hypothetical protein
MRGGCSTFGYKSVVGHVVPDRVGERNGFSIGNGRSIDAASLALAKRETEVSD